MSDALVVGRVYCAPSHLNRPPLSAEERTKRAVAVTVAEAEKPPRHGPPEAWPRPIRIEDPAPPPPIAETPVSEQTATPVVTITISGLPHSGKSVIAHLIRDALAREGVACEGPQGLRSIPWRRAIVNLIYRGLSVQLVKAEVDREAPGGEGDA